MPGLTHTARELPSLPSEQFPFQSVCVSHPEAFSCLSAEGAQFVFHTSWAEACELIGTSCPKLQPLRDSDHVPLAHGATIPAPSWHSWFLSSIPLTRQHFQFALLFISLLFVFFPMQGLLCNNQRLLLCSSPFPFLELLVAGCCLPSVVPSQGNPLALWN